MALTMRPKRSRTARVSDGGHETAEGRTGGEAEIFQPAAVAAAGSLASGARTGADEPFSSLVPAIIGAANLMTTLSATVIVNALPAMSRSLKVDPVQLNTTITVYLLALAVFLPISGWAADRFGAKRVFLASIALYALSCAACAFAQNLPELLIARFAEGAAGALVGPVGRLVLLRSTPKHDLVRALSVLTMPSMLGPVIGPPIASLTCACDGPASASAKPSARPDVVVIFIGFPLWMESAGT